MFFSHQTKTSGWPILSFMTTFLCHFVLQQQPKKSLVSVWTEATIPQVTYPLGCSGNHVGHVHLLGIWHHRRVDGSRRGVCSNEETAEGLRLPCCRNQTEGGTPPRRFSTVLDVVNRVLETRRTSCTMVDAGSVSDCADKSTI